jgi:5-bromo-4-chloroindolyl phosphate hydrolysis protein
MGLLSGQRRRLSGRMAGALMYLLPAPVFLKAIVALWAGNLDMLVNAGVASALFLLAATLARRGLKREIEYRERPRASAPPPPLKAAAGALLAAATGFAAFAVAGHALPVAVVFGAIAALGYFLFYGTDSRGRELAPSLSRGSADEVGAILRDAYQRLDSIEQASARIGTKEFRQRLGTIVGATENILKAIEEDPRDLRQARRFLNVYLDGVQRVTEQYARTHPRTQSLALEQNFRTLLVEMENICDQQYTKLMQNDALDLDVQIEVLNTRLKQEGVS